MLLINVPLATGEYEHQTDAWSPEAWQVHADYLRTLNRGLAEAGELVEVRALTPPGRARRVRAGRNGTPTTDGPFPESKEFLAGFWIVEAATPERAYAIAAQASAAPGPDGAPLNMPIEVRPIPSGPPEV
jgi:hypothetical protein